MPWQQCHPCSGQESGELLQCRYQLIVQEGETVMQRVKELEQALYHIFLNVGVDQADEAPMSFTE